MDACVPSSMSVPDVCTGSRKGVKTSDTLELEFKSGCEWQWSAENANPSLLHGQ